MALPEPDPGSGPEPEPRAGISSKLELGSRLRAIRLEIYGQHGAPMLALALGFSSRAWLEAESQGAISAESMLQFLVLTGAHPHWLLTGEGPTYQRRGESI